MVALISVGPDGSVLEAAFSGEMDGTAQHFLILFGSSLEPADAGAAPELPAGEAQTIPEDTPAPLDPQIDQLKRELRSTREYLQSVIEELRSSNEEAQSSNEELQSTMRRYKPQTKNCNPRTRS